MTPQGQATRDLILEHAARSATVNGLDGLTIGKLAGELKLSKSGVFTLFGSKTDLQLATLERGRAIFVREIMAGIDAAPTTWPRTWATVEAWMSYEKRGVFPGGCFLTNASSEFDSREGPVRDRLRELAREWLETLAETTRADQQAGLLDAGLDPVQVAFELRAAFLATNWMWKLLDDPAAFVNGRALAARTLGVVPAEM
jgi:AcrR family transcriptional regulator